MPAYYNEIDAFCAQWLRNLIAADLIAPGDVDERDIRDVRPDDLKGYTQLHFFAGIGGWSLALRLAAWPDDKPCWTGSCPCQPFSHAGQREGFDDDRHLWPIWFDLVKAVRPAIVFGEQVAGAVKFGWLDLVLNDMDQAGYTTGAIVLPACSVGAPHIRSRLWFYGTVADAERGATGIREGRGTRAAQLSSGPNPARRGSNGHMADAERRSTKRKGHQLAEPPQGSAGQARRQRLRPDLGDGSAVDQLADTAASGSSLRRRGSRDEPAAIKQSKRLRANGVMADPKSQLDRGRPPRTTGRSELADSGSMGNTKRTRSQERGSQAGDRSQASGQPQRQATERASVWDDLVWLQCSDGKQRPTRSGLFPLATGVPNRVAKLRAIGNSIVPQVGAQFVQAVEEVLKRHG